MDAFFTNLHVRNASAQAICAALPKLTPSRAYVSPRNNGWVGQAVEKDVAGVTAHVFTAEHLAAIALQTGRAKDKARLLQFIEAGGLDIARFQDIILRHGLIEAWKRFERQFLRSTW